MRGSWKVKAVGLTVVLLGMGALVWVTAPRGVGEGVLAGEVVYDFGVVVIETGRPLRLKHEFVLRNEGGRTLTVGRVRSTCGCTVADVGERQIGPGEELRVAATLTLESPGVRSAHVLVDLGREGWTVLEVSARGQRRQHFYAVEQGVPLDEGGRGRLTLVATSVESDERPGEPVVEGPEWLGWRFGGWELVHPRLEEYARPARWHGVVQVERIAACGLEVGLPARHGVVGLEAQRPACGSSPTPDPRPPTPGLPSAQAGGRSGTLRAGLEGGGEVGVAVW